MRYLHYTNYQSGGAGLSNGIMSIEIGVVLAHLTNRLLVLDGNVSPPANVVKYDGRVDNQRPSRVTDLLEIPVPWAEADEVDLAGLPSRELTDQSLADLVFYFPKTRDVTSSDARSFARGRAHWLTVTGADEDVPVLRLTEAPLVPGAEHHRDNLGSYSYLFYLDDELRRSVYRLLARMQAKRPFAELAEKVARDIGPFNAVHMRRGDFKVTYGVTTLDRKPHEAIEAMDQVFARKDALVIVTDERDDPFFDEIKRAYPHHLFIDWHILDNYAPAWAALPRTDSLSLAHLSQLVAGRADEFMGTMTSTFTGLIQRYRGNRGKDERFRYLWNELPERGEQVERGRHGISECIALDRGQMIEESAGPYSWNRVSQRLNPAWMREWPESFLSPEVLATGALPGDRAAAIEIITPGVAAPAATIVRGVAAPALVVAAVASVIHVSFENLQVALWCNDGALLRRLAPALGSQSDTEARNVIGNFDLSTAGASCTIQQRGLPEKTVCDKAQLPIVLKQRIVAAFALARHKYTWLMAAVFARSGRGVLIAGDVGEPAHAFRQTLETRGWELLDAGPFAIRIEDLMIVPLGARQQPEVAATRVGRLVTPLESLVVLKRAALYVQDASITQLSPAAAVAALIGTSLDFHIDQHRAVTALCRVVEQRPAVQVGFGRPHEAARMIARWMDSLQEVAA